MSFEIAIMCGIVLIVALEYVYSRNLIHSLVIWLHTVNTLCEHFEFPFSLENNNNHYMVDIHELNGIIMFNITSNTQVHIMVANQFDVRLTYALQIYKDSNNVLMYDFAMRMWRARINAC